MFIAQCELQIPSRFSKKNKRSLFEKKFSVNRCCKRKAGFSFWVRHTRLFRKVKSQFYFADYQLCSKQQHINTLIKSNEEARYLLLLYPCRTEYKTVKNKARDQGLRGFIVPAIVSTKTFQYLHCVAIKVQLAHVDIISKYKATIQRVKANLSLKRFFLFA